ncbi:MAG: TIGR04086 family membrane protein [Acutalibacteraceae bacterium]
MGKKTPSKRNEKKLNPTLKIFLKTQIIAAISYISVFLISSIVCLSLDMKKNNMFYVSALSFAAASFICAYYAGYKIHKNGLAVGLLYSLPANILVIIISVIVNGFKIDLTVLISLFILLISSMLAGVLSVNTKLKTKRK